MTPLHECILAADTAAAALAQILGRTDRAAEVRARIRDLRRALALAGLSDLAARAEGDPAAYLRRAVELAATSGLAWDQIAAIVTSANLERGRDQ